MKTLAAACMALAVLFCAAGCLSDNDSVVADVSPRKWNEPVEMTYTNSDTLSDRRVTLFLRHDNRTRTGKYALELRAPSEEIVFTDTLIIDLPLKFRFPPRIGPLFSMHWKSHLLAKTRLTEVGDYVFTATPLQQARGVWSIGLDLRVRDGKR